VQLSAEQTDAILDDEGTLTSTFTRAAGAAGIVHATVQLPDNGGERERRRRYQRGANVHDHPPELRPSDAVDRTLERR